MTTVAVLTDPPHPDIALSTLVETTPISKGEAAELYEALLRDTVLAAAKSGGDVLVNYRPAAAFTLDIDSKAEIRDIVADTVELDSVRFEVQVGETFAGRAGNTATHLLETEGVGSVGIVRPEAAMLARTDIDSAAMKLRSAPVVLGPAPGGRIGYAAFADTIDFADCYAPPALETLTNRALEADLGVDFLETKPYLETPSDLAEIVLTVRTRQRADALVPPYLATWVENCGLDVSTVDGELCIDR